MDKFTDRYLNYLAGKRSPNKGVSFLWPVWVWQVIAPSPEHSRPNIFQRSILGLIRAHQTDPNDIADWLGVETDLVLYIMAAQLMPDGYLDSHGKITQKGNELLDNDLDARRQLTVGYVFQDVFNLKVWPRIVTRLPYVEASSVDKNGWLRFRQSRQHDQEESPFHVICRGLKPEQPGLDELRDMIRQGNNAIHNQKVRDELDIDDISEYRVDEIEIIDPNPIPAYIFCWAIPDPEQYWTVSDPAGITPSAEWMREAVYLQAQKKPIFAKRLSFFLEDVKEKETWEERNQRIEAKIEFEMSIGYPEIKKIPYLSAYFGALHRQKDKLEETEDGKEHFEDCNALISQAQIVVECCFKWMLTQWSFRHPQTIKQNWNSDDVKIALKSAAGYLLTDSNINGLSRVPAKTIYAAAYHEAPKVSLRPLVAATILALPEHEDHPIRNFTKKDGAITNILKLADYRNLAGHASGEFTPRKQALNFAYFSIQWVQNLTRSQE